MERDGIEFGARLRACREAAGLSQEELASRSGLSVRAVSNIERGRTQWPYRDSLNRLADALGLREAARAEFLAAVPRRLARPLSPEQRDRAAHAGDVPRQLPAAVGCFTGREAELAALSGLLTRRSGSVTPTVLISAIGGTAGVGKTALAIEWAHRVAGQFPDGQLYVNLRGYDPDQPVSVANALAGFLRALGVSGQDIPDATDDRARLYRSRLADRRVLVVLDNAREADQVRPLLPGDPGCVAVVTSRDALAGLAAIDGARRLNLDVLPLPDAVTLLGSLIGPRAREDPAAVAALARLCARLPLALRITAELAADRPSVPLAELAGELEASRLDGLDAGEERADVRTVFSWSCRQLPDDVAGAFALIGLHPGEDLDVYAVAALIGNSAGSSPGQARHVLGRLHRASLLQATGPDRYGMHDLLRAYAREQAAARDTDGQRDRALTRLFDYYLAATAAAMDILFPAEAHSRPRVDSAAAELPSMPDEADARAWLEAERANLAAMAAHCAGPNSAGSNSAGHGWLRQTADLARTLFRYLMAGSHLPEAHIIYGHVLDAARRSGDLAVEADALNGLGGIDMMKGHFRDAVAHYRASLQLHRQRGNRAGQAQVLRNLGIADQEQHDLRSAAVYYRQAIAAFEDVGNSLDAARALTELAAVETELDSYDQAAEHLRFALQVFRKAEDQRGEARALSGTGELDLRRGELASAAAFFEQALIIFRDIGHLASVAAQLGNLGGVSLRQCEYQQAIGYFQQALALFRKTGYQHGETVMLRSLAEAMHGADQPAAARAELAVALRLAAETGNTYQQASAHRDLGDSHHAAGDDEQARHHWQQALTLYTQLGAPEADQVESRLRSTTAVPGN